MDAWPIEAARRQKGIRHDRRVTSQISTSLERILTLEIVRVTERAAVAAARLRGRGDEKAADQAAVDAMRRETQQAADRRHGGDRRGRARRGADAVHRREGRQRHGPKVDIAVDPLEGTTLCAKNMPGAIAIMAMAEGGTLLNAPDVYMEKIAIGPGYPQGRRRSRRAPEENIRALAKAKGVKPSARSPR